MIKSYRVTFLFRALFGFFNLAVDHGHLLLEMCLLLLQVVRFGRQPHLLRDSELVVSPDVLNVELQQIVEQVVVVIEDDLWSLIWLWRFNVLVLLLKDLARWTRDVRQHSDEPLVVRKLTFVLNEFQGGEHLVVLFVHQLILLGLGDCIVHCRFPYGQEFLLWRWIRT